MQLITVQWIVAEENQKLHKANLPVLAFKFNQSFKGQKKGKNVYPKTNTEGTA